MKKIFQIFNQINALRLFYILIIFSLILSILEYSFIYIIYSLVDYQLTSNVNLLLENVINYFKEIFETKFKIIDIILIFLIIIFCFKTIIYIFYNYLISFFSQNISFNLSKLIFANSLSNKKDVLINNKNSSYFKNTIIVDIPLFISSVVQPLFFLVNDALILAAILIFLFYTNSLISLYLVLFIFLTCLIFYLYLKNKLIKWGNIREKSSTNLIKNLNEVYKGLLEIKIYNVAKYFFSKVLYELNSIKESLIKTNFFIHFPRIVLEIIIFFSIFFLIFVSSNNNSDISVLPYLSAAVAAAIKIIPMFSRIMTGIQGYYFAKEVVNKVNTLINNNSIKEDLFENSKKFNGVDKIQIKNFSFKFKDKILLKKINLVIKKNSIVGITGESGSGKSTFARVLGGVEKNFTGSIKYFDKKDQLKYGLPALGLSAIIPQEVFAFDDTLENNITFKSREKKLIKDKKPIQNLLKNLGIYRNRIIGEDGKRISGGQKQRLGIIRSLFFDKEILIFDESTSNLDKKNKLIILNIVKKLKQEKLILIISHDKKFLDICDKLFELKEGRLLKRKRI